jgi:DNA-binding beta-propeller fold protein YncE
MRLSIGFIVLGIAAAALVVRAQDTPSAAEYKIVKTAKVGGEGGFDYVFADSDGRKLYVPRSGGRGNGAVKSRVDVFDLDTLAPPGRSPTPTACMAWRSIPNPATAFPAAIPSSCSTPKLWPPSKPSPTDGSPDGIFFEPATQRIYVLSHRDPNVTVLDAKDGSIVGTIDLGGAPEQGQSDGNGHVYIDLEDQDRSPPSTPIR